MVDHNKIYNWSYYYQNNNNNSYYEKRLRFSDQFSSILYTFDISFLELLNIFRNLTPRDFNYDLQINISAEEQFQFIELSMNKNRCRIPKSIIDVGAGRGEITAFLNYCKLKLKDLNYEIQSLDVSPIFESMYKDTCQRLFSIDLPQDLLIGTLYQLYEKINYDTVDTIIMSEVLEHLHQEEFWYFFNYSLPFLKRNGTRLIICNNWGYWPIEENGVDHIWRIDDSVYDKIEAYGKRIFRSRSHLVVDF